MHSKKATLNTDHSKRPPLCLQGHHYARKDTTMPSGTPLCPQGHNYAHRDNVQPMFCSCASICCSEIHKHTWCLTNLLNCYASSREQQISRCTRCGMTTQKVWTSSTNWWPRWTYEELVCGRLMLWTTRIQPKQKNSASTCGKQSPPSCNVVLKFIVIQEVKSKLP